MAEKQPKSLTKTQMVLEDLAQGMTIAQACAKNRIQERHFLRYAKYAVGRAAAEALLIQENLNVIKGLRDNAKTKDEVRLKAAQFFLERIYRRQYGQDDRQVVIHAEQTNYSLDAKTAREIDTRAERLLLANRDEGRIQAPLPKESESASADLGPHF